MTAAHEAFVARRFDALQSKFKTRVGETDYRLVAVQQSLGELAGSRILDLGCGKGRFARRLSDLGARVTGLDISAGMLAHAIGVDRAIGSALRLPFASAAFEAVIAIEVLEHLPQNTEIAVFREVRRVLRPGGRFVVLDKSRLALDANRPWLPRLLVKRIDERRGRWMYRPGEIVRERWFGPWDLKRRMMQVFGDAQVRFLVSEQERKRAVFRVLPWLCSMVCWTARRREGVA